MNCPEVFVKPHCNGVGTMGSLDCNKQEKWTTKISKFSSKYLNMIICINKIPITSSLWHFVEKSRDFTALAIIEVNTVLDCPQNIIRGCIEVF